MDNMEMAVYGACYQDDMEPWGWAPQQLFFNREDAEVEMEKLIDKEMHTTPQGYPREMIARCYSVQEYTVK